MAKKDKRAIGGERSPNRKKKGRERD